MVLAEEFSDWADSTRRIDLLCLDDDANLVVVELKRTEDGGHMELQALRYAAMVSAMTFDQAVETLARHRNRANPDTDADPAPPHAAPTDAAAAQAAGKGAPHAAAPPGPDRTGTIEPLPGVVMRSSQ